MCDPSTALCMHVAKCRREMQAFKNESERDFYSSSVNQIKPPEILMLDLKMRWQARWLSSLSLYLFERKIESERQGFLFTLSKSNPLEILMSDI